MAQKWSKIGKNGPKWSKIGILKAKMAQNGQTLDVVFGVAASTTGTYRQKGPLYHTLRCPWHQSGGWERPCALRGVAGCSLSPTFDHCVPVSPSKGLFLTVWGIFYLQNAYFCPFWAIFIAKRPHF